QARRAFFSNTISLRGVVFPPPKLVTETGGLSGVFFTMLRYSFALHLETFFLPTAGESTADSTLFFFDLCGRYGYGYGYGKRPRCYGPSTASSFPLERPLRPDFFGCFFRPLSLSSSFSSSSSSSSFPSYGPTPPLRPFQGRGIQQFLDQFEEKVPEQSQRVDWLPFFVAPPCLRQIQVLTEDLPWPAAKTALLRYYGAFDQIRTVGFYEKLRRHEARRPKTKDTIDWLEKHAFFCRKVGPGPDESTEHSYGLFQALPKEIQVQLYDKLERPSSSPYGILFSTAYFLTQIQLEDDSFSGLST
ncbi:hypothetical protein L249_6204, partial [Ophiocordyceps polyrhachis-furcata BCC 54312]